MASTTVPPQQVTKKVEAHGKETEQAQPGVEAKMATKPQYILDSYQGAEKLSGKVAIITGGDSGIGRAVAIHYAREGATGITIVYKDDAETVDAKETVRLVEAEGSTCMALMTDVGDPTACEKVVETTIKMFGHLDILVNNAGEQHMEAIEDVTLEHLQRIFSTNVFSLFYLTKAALPHMQAGSCIINSSSVVAYRGHARFLCYAATKGGVTSFTRTLSAQLVEKGIRVNAVAPGPIWTPFIPSTTPEDKVADFGASVPMKRMGQPSEVAPAYVFLASKDASYFTGQTIHPNGGAVLNT